MIRDTQKHHRRSIRLRGYDYSQPGAYFVTILTQDRHPLFGEIVDSVNRLSIIGDMVEHEWLRLELRFHNITLDTYVIMHNYIHGIITLNETCKGTGDSMDGSILEGIPRALTVERFGAPTPGSIQTIIRSYKSSTTLRYHRMMGDITVRMWHRNYFEHNIRDERELERIREYIQANPSFWMGDEEYVKST